jgi:hypothetical protein
MLGAILMDRATEELVKAFGEDEERGSSSSRDRGHFQVAYGHRRLRAAELLQIKVKAVVRYLSDIEMVVVQGKENSDRRDLSFIERAAATADLRLHLRHCRIRRKAWFRTNTGLTQPDGGSSRFKGGRRGRLSFLTKAWSPPLESTSRRISAIFTPSLRAGEGWG